jgi:hypothetical protein
MPRKVTLTFEDGSQHIYDEVPDSVKPTDIESRATKQFADKKLVSIKGEKVGAKDAIPSREEPKGGALSVFDALSALPKFAGAEAVMALQRGAKSAGGALTGAAAIPERGLALAKEAGLDILQDTSVGEPGATEAALRQMTGAPAGDLYFGGGKLAGEMAATAGMPAFIARSGAKVLPAAAQTPAVNRLLAAIESGGLGEAGGANYLQRIIGGGIAGATPGFLMGGTEGAAMAGGLGAALPAVVRPAAAVAAPLTSRIPQAAGYLSEKVAQFRQPEKAALAQATGDKIESIISTLGREGAIVPGTQPHAGEVAAKAGSTGFSALVAKTFKDVPEIRDILQDRQATNMLARDLYNRGLFRSADEAERTLLDTAGRQGMETDLLGTMGQQMEAEKNILAKEAEDVAAGIREPSQMRVGETVRGERAKQIESITKNRIQPLFEKAKEYDQPFDVSSVQNVASKVSKENTGFAKDLDPDAAAILQKLQPRLASKWKYDEQGNFIPERFEPPSITMSEAIELNKALNREYGRLKGSEIPGAAQTMRGINEIKAALKESIDTNVPKEFADAFSEANKSFKQLIVEPFKKSEFAKLELTGAGEQALLKGSDVAERILAKPEYAQQFVRQMKDSPEALEAAAEGIEGLFRNKAVVEGRIKPDAAARFLKDNKEALDILKQGGIDIESRLSGIVTKGRSAELAAKLAEQTRQPLEAFSSPEGLRAGLRNKPELMNTAAKYLGEEERKGLARGMLMDAFEDTADATAHLMKNQKAIKKALELSNPGKSDRLFLDAVNTAQLYDDVLKNQKLIGDLDPVVATSQRQEKIARLTKGLTPQQMRDVTAIQRDLARVKAFEDLAKAGISPKKGIMDEMFSEFELPPFFSKIVTVAKRIMKVTKDKLSRIKSAELAAAFLEPKMTKQLLEETKAWQAETLKKKAAATAGTKRVMEKTAAAGRGAARAAVLGTANAMAPESNNQNALMR